MPQILSLWGFFLYKYHLGKNTSVIFKISCVIVIILYSRVIKLKMEKFPNFILISYLLLWQQMERVIWLCNLFLKCEIQILCSNWNPLRFQEKLSHFQHSLSPFISFPPKFANSIAVICSWLHALLEKNTFFPFDVQIWSTSSLTLCLLLLGSFTMAQKLSIIFLSSTLKKNFPKSTKTRSPAPKKYV